MRRLLLLVMAVVGGFSVGAGVMLALQQPDPSTAPQPPASSPGPAADGEDGGTVTGGRDGTEAGSGSGEDAPEALIKPAPVPEPSPRLLLAWTSGGLPEGFDDAVAEVPAVEATTVVHGGMVELEHSLDAEGRSVDDLEDDWVIPLDVVALEPGSYGEFISKAAMPLVAGLGPGEALLSETGARLRGLDEGGRLSLRDGPELMVAGVVDDAQLAGAEAAVTIGTAQGTPAETPRYVLLTYRGDRAEVEQALRALLPEGPPLRLRGPGESPVLRHGDAVLTQAEIKERFGEFAYRRLGGDTIEQDPEWVEAHIETAEVPVLGEVRCHRAVLPALADALGELEREHLGHTVDASDYAGCHNPRLTRDTDSVSRHAWGIAFDVNARDNPIGQSSAQDPRMVEMFERWGFTWGGPWLVPDPAHFEYVRPPDPAATQP